MDKEQTNIQEVLRQQILQNQVLKERIGTLVTQYEDQDAQRRVQITVLTNTVEQYEERIKELEKSLEPTENEQTAQAD